MLATSSSGGRRKGSRVGKEELVAELEQEFAALMEAVQGLSDEQTARRWCGSWSVRDILAHIIGWHHEMDDALERIARGEKPVPEGVDYSDVDAFNARFVQTWQGTSPAALLAELKASKDLLVAAARLVPEERFEEGRAAYRIFRSVGADHYREHAPEIKAWRQREGI